LNIERGGIKMSRFRQGMLIGLILSVLITLALAMTLDDERRRQLRYRFEQLRNTLPGVEQLRQSVQKAATRARETGSNLGEHVQESAGKLVQHTQERLSTTQTNGASLGEKQETKETV
jgi:gas vesicle protein